MKIFNKKEKKKFFFTFSKQIIFNISLAISGGNIISCVKLLNPTIGFFKFNIFIIIIIIIIIKMKNIYININFNNDFNKN